LGLAGRGLAAAGLGAVVGRDDTLQPPPRSNTWTATGQLVTASMFNGYLRDSMRKLEPLTHRHNGRADDA